MTGFLALLGLTRAGFTAPSFAIFTDLITGWICAPGRRTISAMIAVADPAERAAPHSRTPRGGKTRVCRGSDRRRPAAGSRSVDRCVSPPCQT